MMVQILRICFDSMEAEEGSAPHVSFIKEIRQDFRSGASPLGYMNSSFLINRRSSYRLSYTPEQYKE
jgi:hypothetical protein